MMFLPQGTITSKSNNSWMLLYSNLIDVQALISQNCRIPYCMKWVMHLNPILSRIHLDLAKDFSNFYLFLRISFAGSLGQFQCLLDFQCVFFYFFAKTFQEVGNHGSLHVYFFIYYLIER